MINVLMFILSVVFFAFLIWKYGLSNNLSTIKSNKEKFNSLFVIFLLIVLWLSSIITVIVDLLVDTDHNIELGVFVLLTIGIMYYLSKNRSNIRHYCKVLRGVK